MREILLLAWRNLWRSRRRTLITLAAGAFGLMFSQGYLNWADGIYAQMVDDGARSGAGHLAVYADGYLATREESLTFPAGDLPDRLAALPGVSAVLPRRHLPGLAQSARGSRGVLIVGVDPAREWAVNPFARGLVEGRLLDGTDLRDALVGKDLLEALQLKVGGKLVLMAQGRGSDLQSELVRVAGVLDTGLEEADARSVFVSLEFAGRLAGGPGRIHEAAVVLDDQRTVPRVLATVRGMLPPGVEAVPWEKAMPELASHIRVDLFSLKLIIAFIFLIVLIGTVNTLLMSVLERTREFGVMMALGVPTPFLTGTVVTEGILMGFLAAAVGTGLGSAATAALAHWGVDLSSLYGADRLEVSGIVFSGVMRARWAPASMAAMALIVAALYPLAALYPAWRVTRLRPVDTMR